MTWWDKLPFLILEAFCCLFALGLGIWAYEIGQWVGAVVMWCGSLLAAGAFYYIWFD